ncbi:hypothetical protein ACFWIQ_05065 [Kitasatospora sp. NPDC127059]|uniref:hypothetical protein n=1 Tax=unclassified Kitasatospora TaxID=2633591 RepID=UPI0036492495
MVGPDAQVVQALKKDPLYIDGSLQVGADRVAALRAQLPGGGTTMLIAELPAGSPVAAGADADDLARRLSKDVADSGGPVALCIVLLGDRLGAAEPESVGVPRDTSSPSVPADLSFFVRHAQASHPGDSQGALLELASTTAYVAPDLAGQASRARDGASASVSASAAVEAAVKRFEENAEAREQAEARENLYAVLGPVLALALWCVRMLVKRRQGRHR